MNTSRVALLICVLFSFLSGSGQAAKKSGRNVQFINSGLITIATAKATQP